MLHLKLVGNFVSNVQIVFISNDLHKELHDSSAFLISALSVLDFGLLASLMKVHYPKVSFSYVRTNECKENNCIYISKF